MGERTANVVDGDLGETLSSLSKTIHGRWDYSPDESYTALLLTSKEDKCLGKLVEEANEVVMACKDDDHDHIRYEMGDVLYHLLVVAERYGISLEELAGELNARMK
ncbi:MAG: phosphoribosyl-ATP diphosphatase [Coriobacteriales bacterium]